MTDIKEEYRLKNLSGSDAKKILECADQENIDIGKITDFINKLRGGEKMSDKEEYEGIIKEKEAKIERYMQLNKGVSYRDAVLEVLIDSEEKDKEEGLTPEETAIKKFIEKNPDVTYRQAVLAVLPLSKKEE